MGSLVTAALQSKAENKCIYIYINVQTLLLYTVRDCMGWKPGETPVYRLQCPEPPAAKPHQGVGTLWAFTASFQVMKGHTIILMASHCNQL